MGQVPAWLTATQAIGTAMFQSWTVTFATRREGAWIKREENPKWEFRGEPLVLGRKKIKKIKSSQSNWIWTEQKAVCSQL